MSDGGNDIIIKGGVSVELHFDDTGYIKQRSDPKVHKRDNRKITRIQISGGGLSFDSEPTSSDVTITVHCEPEN